MAAFNFPNAPTPGQIFVAPGGAIWSWNGYAWLGGAPSEGGDAGDFVLKAGDTMTGPLVLPGVPTVALEAATKSYVDMVSEFVGSFSAADGSITWTATGGGSGTSIPAAAAENEGWYLVCEAAGSTSPTGAPAVAYNAGDWIFSDGTAWIHKPFGGISSVAAGDVTVTPTVSGESNAQDALEALEVDIGTLAAMISGKLDKTGGTMTGPIVLPGSPANPLEAATKAYVDAATGGSGAITEAPTDGDHYTRRNSAWVSWGATVWTARVLIAGAGLAGGGDLSADRTFSIGAGTGIQVNADDVALQVPVQVIHGGTGGTTQAEAKTNLGLGNVDNTSDINKPLSTATQTALNDKVAKTGDAMSGPLTMNAKLVMGQDTARTGVITPTAISANTNDYNPSGGATASIWRVSATAGGFVFTGFAGGYGGRELTLVNVGAFPIALSFNNAASAAANRIAIGPSNPVTIPANGFIDLWYDGTVNNWRTKQLSAIDQPDALTAFNSIKQAASATTAGVVEHATDAEVRAAAVGNFAILASHQASAAAWVGQVYAATLTLDWKTGINFQMNTMTGNMIVGNPTNGITGTYRTLWIAGADATPRTVTFGSNFKGTLPVLTDVSNGKQYLLTIFCVDPATLFLVTSVQLWP